MEYILELVLAAVIAVLSYFLGQSNARLKEKEKVADSSLKAEKIRRKVVSNDEEAMAVDSLNRDKKKDE